MSEKQAEAAAKEEEYRLAEIGRQDRTALRAFIDEWWIAAEKEFFDLIGQKLKDDGYDETETAEKISEISSLLDKKDNEDRKELIAEFIEGYYESIAEPDEDEDFWEEFIEELYERD